MKHTILTLLALLLATAATAQELTGRFDLETRAFPEGALFEQQHESNLSLAFEPEVYWPVGSGAHSFTVTPFARLDLGDSERTHIDLREAYWQYVGRTWRRGSALPRCSGA